MTSHSHFADKTISMCQRERTQKGNEIAQADSKSAKMKVSTSPAAGCG